MKAAQAPVVSSCGLTRAERATQEYIKTLQGVDSVIHSLVHSQIKMCDEIATAAELLVGDGVTAAPAGRLSHCSAPQSHRWTKFRMKQESRSLGN